MGFEDETSDTDDAVKAANEYAENKRNEAEAARLKTIAQMQENQEELKKKQQQLAQLSELLGINEMRHKIDQQDQSITYLATRMDEMIKTLNNFVASQEPAIPPSAAAGIPQMDKLNALQALGPTLEQIANAWRIFKGHDQQPAQQLIDPEVINQHIQKSIMGNFEVGEAIIEGLKDKLTRKAMNSLVNQAIHEPE